jgi:hypothetical protein
MDAAHFAPDRGTAGTSLFDAPADNRPAWVQTWATTSPAQRKAIRESWERALEPIAIELADRRGGEGITASELLTEAILRGVLWGERSFLKVPANRRIYSFIGPMLRRLAREQKLAPKKLPLVGGGFVIASRVSDRPDSHGNENDIYLHLRYAA